MAAQGTGQGLLYADDLITIQPGQLLGATPLYIAIEALLAGRPGTIVLNPDMVFLSTANRNADELQARVASVSHMGGQVFIPIMVNGATHYVLAVANFANRTIRFYDSIMGRINDDILRIVGRIIPPSAPGEEPWNRGFFPCVGQRNNLDCGVSCFLNVVHSLNHPEARDLTALPHVPANFTAGDQRRRGQRAMYWIAARAAILSLCRVRALQDITDNADNVQRRLTDISAHIDRFVNRVNNPVEEAGALAWVINELTTLNTEHTVLLGPAIGELVRLTDNLPVNRTG